MFFRASTQHKKIMMNFLRYRNYNLILYMIIVLFYAFLFHSQCYCMDNQIEEILDDEDTHRLRVEDIILYITRSEDLVDLYYVCKIIESKTPMVMDDSVEIITDPSQFYPLYKESLYFRFKIVLAWLIATVLLVFVVGSWHLVVMYFLDPVPYKEFVLSRFLLIAHDPKIVEQVYLLVYSQ